MCVIECIKSPNAEQIQPIIDGVVAYGEQQVKENTPEKYRNNGHSSWFLNDCDAKIKPLIVLKNHYIV